uniref:Protein krueppel n=1 Tax=Anopheles arabiensis TaxID=7173 RepID=A0A182HHW1_ANOAR
MARAESKFYNRCRFCFNQDEQKLMPLSITLDATLTILDVEHFTGLNDLDREDKPFMVCDGCDRHVNVSVAFRNTCRRNDAFFKQEPCNESAEDDDDKDEAMDTFAGPASEMSISADETAPEKDVFADEDTAENHDIDEESSDDFTWPEAPSPKVEKIVRRRLPKTESTSRRKKTINRKWLCTICGLFMTNYTKHMQRHIDPTPFACPHCDKKMSDSANMKRHIDAVHLKIVVATCEECNLPFYVKPEYKWHMVRVHGQGDMTPRYKCQFCPKAFYFHTRMRVHMEQKHYEHRNYVEKIVRPRVSKTESTSGRKKKIRRRWLCSICGLFTLKYTKHMQKHIDPTPFACPHCDKKMSDPCNMKRHIAVVHLKIVVAKCEECNLSFHGKPDYKWHMKIHSSEAHYQCRIPMCSRRFRSANGRRQHEMTHSGIIFGCDQCDKQYHSTENRDIDEESSDDFTWPEAPSPKVEKIVRPRVSKTESTSGRKKKIRRRWLCSICGLFTLKYTKHMQKHIDPTPFACPHCDKKMSDPCNMKRHFAVVHLKIVVAKCEECNLSFHGKPDYKWHMVRVHGQGDMTPRYKCQFCPKAFYFHTRMRVHMEQKHYEHRNYVCKICGMRFKTKYDGAIYISSYLNALLVHKKIHSSEAHYQCRIPMCSRRFRSANGRRQHEMTHSGIIFGCDQCDKQYHSSSLLKAHKQDQLVPLITIVDSSLTLENIERFTGIENLEEESKQYASCSDCHMALLSSVSFRNTCLANEALFRELCTVVEEHLDDDEADEFVVEELQETVSEMEFIVVNNRKKRKATERKESPAGKARTCSRTTRSVNDGTKPDTDYCANRIELGEPFSSDEEQRSTRAGQVILDKEALFAESLRLIREAQERNVHATAETLESAGDESNDSSHAPPVASERHPRTPKMQLCEVCGKVVQKLSEHIAIHTKEMRYACPHCPVRMANHANLYRHVQAVHLKRVVKSCEICAKGFTSNASYKSHMRSEHGIGETYECKLCPKKFNHPGNYRVHFIRCHSDVRKFTCTICGKQFKEKRDHRNHQRVHSDDKPFGCSQCPKLFKSDYARKTHELTHSGVVFRCAHCDKGYRYKCLLNIHIKKDHTATIKQEGTND